MADSTNPTDMTDDELKDAIEGEPEAKEEPDVPEASEDAEEPESTEEPEATEDPEAKEEEEQKPSRRESLRIQQLVDKLKQKDEAPASKKAEGLDYDTLDADDETKKALQADRDKYGEDLYRQGLEQTKSIQFHTRLEIDAPRVEAKYPQFDKDSKEFNPTVANAINNWYLATVGYDAKTNTVSNAQVRYVDFVEGIMELADEMAGEKTVEAKKNITKQAAQTGLRPDGSSPKRMNLDQAPESMTDDELKAVIAQAIPIK